jgi:phage terminase large subunit
MNIIPCTKGAGSVVAGITALQDFEIIVTPSSQNVKKELNNYCWNDKKSGIPQDAWNHCIDPMRYSLTHLQRPATYFG